MKPLLKICEVGWSGDCRSPLVVCVRHRVELHRRAEIDSDVIPGAVKTLHLSESQRRQSWGLCRQIYTSPLLKLLLSVSISRGSSTDQWILISKSCGRRAGRTADTRTTQKVAIGQGVLLIRTTQRVAVSSGLHDGCAQPSSYVPIHARMLYGIS